MFDFYAAYKHNQQYKKKDQSNSWDLKATMPQKNFEVAWGRDRSELTAAKEVGRDDMDSFCLVLMNAGKLRAFIFKLWKYCCVTFTYWNQEHGKLG